MAKPGWMGSTGITDAGDPPDEYGDWGPVKTLAHVQKFIDRGYTLTVRWRPFEQRYHAYVHEGTVHSSHNFMAASVKEALEGLDRYLESHAHQAEVKQDV